MNFTIVIFTALLLSKDLEAFKLKRSLLDNFQNGLRMMGRNHNKIKFLNKNHQTSAGVSNKVADLVSFAFTKNNEKTNEKRQDAVVVGDNSDVLFTPDSSLMSGLLKVLGFDGAKIGAFALNGIIFIAQMVRDSASKIFNFVMSKTWDLYLKVDRINNQIKNETAAKVPHLEDNKQKFFITP